MGGIMPTILNSANEIAVEAFLKDKIAFNEIGDFVEKILHKYNNIKNPTLDDILETDKMVREENKI